MTIFEARELADKITQEELNQMFESAKFGIKDWTKVSRINKGMSKGALWNILYGALRETPVKLLSGLAKRNMVFEFQEFLPKNLIPDNKIRNNTHIEIIHQDPIF